MPNGGSDHCGNCRHNRVNVGRESTIQERLGPAHCTIRKVDVKAAFHTYCANHFKDHKHPIGPMYGSISDGDRVPYHGMSYPRTMEVATCRVCGGPSQGRLGVQVADDRLGKLEFCGALHYVQWWKTAHPGETLPWDVEAPPETPERPLEIQVQIDLARAYLEIQDFVAAREVLEGAQSSAQGAQREEVRGLLAKIPPAGR